MSKWTSSTDYWSITQSKKRRRSLCAESAQSPTTNMSSDGIDESPVDAADRNRLYDARRELFLFELPARERDRGAGRIRVGSGSRDRRKALETEIQEREIVMKLATRIS